MRRNTLLAIVISAAVMVVYFLFLAPKPKTAEEQAAAEAQKPATEQTTPATTATTPATTTTPTTSPATTTQPQVTPAATTPETTPTVAALPMEGSHSATITTPLYTMVMLDGEVYYLALKKYTGQARYDPLPFVTKLIHPAADNNPGSVTEFDRPFRLYGETAEADAILDGGYVLAPGSPTELNLGNPESGNQLTFVRKLSDGTTISRTYTFHKDNYELDLDIAGIPATVQSVALGLGTLATAIPAPGIADAAQLGIAEYGTRSEEENLITSGSRFFKDILNEKRTRRHDSENYTFACLGGRYFGMIAYDPQGLITATESVYNPAGAISGRVWFNPAKTAHLVLWAGPKEHDMLETIGAKAGLEKMIDFGGWVGFIGYWIFRLLRFFGELIGNYGIAIIILTLISKVLLWPLSAKSIKSSIAMQKVQPELAALREKYKDDKQKLNQETMALYQRHKINPVSGCLPLLIQMPIFFALYAALRNAVELRGAGFLYIRDLSEPDALFHLPFTIPIIGASSFNLMPLIMLGLMVWQQRMSTPKNAPKQEGQGMMKAMPIVFGFLFYNMPSGLVIYWLLNTLLSIFQQMYAAPKIKQQIDAVSGTVMAAGSPSILKVGAENDPWFTIWVPHEMPDKKYLDGVIREMAERGSRLTSTLIEKIQSPLSWRPDYSKRERDKQKGGWEITVRFTRRTR
jgi:YidC/Oxa1 family membrane protein insertase